MRKRGCLVGIKHLACNYKVLRVVIVELILNSSHGLIIYVVSIGFIV